MEKCDVCGNKIDDFEECTHEKVSAGSFGSRMTSQFVVSGNEIDFDEESTDSRNITPLLVGPFFALILDILIPAWSTMLTSVGLVALSTLLVNTLWTNIGSGTSFSFSTLLKSLPRQLLTPNLIKLHATSSAAKKNIGIWTGAMFISVLAVQFIGTPGNASGLENQLNRGINSKTGQNIDVSCPTFFSAFPGNTTNCQVKIIFGVKIPVHVTVTDVFGHIKWNASIN